MINVSYVEVCEVGTVGNTGRSPSFGEKNAFLFRLPSNLNTGLINKG